MLSECWISSRAIVGVTWSDVMENMEDKTHESCSVTRRADPALGVARNMNGCIIAKGSSCPAISQAATSLVEDFFRLGDSFYS